MTQLQWDKTGERLYETGVDHGVLYIPNALGQYLEAHAWNGLVSVSESPTGAEATPQYADNMKYLNLVSLEEFGATIEAFTYPTAFGQCDGSAEPSPGILIGQQPRRSFGFCYRTLLGNDVDATEYGYKLHLVYGALATPTEKAYATVNESPEAITFSWDITTTAVLVEGYKPTATLTIDSTQVDAETLADLEELLYGTSGTDAQLPLPSDVIAMFEGTVTTVTPVAPTFDSLENEITIPTVTGIVYKIDGDVVTGVITITEDVVVEAVPTTGYKFPAVTDKDWFFNYTP